MNLLQLAASFMSVSWYGHVLYPHTFTVQIPAKNVTLSLSLKTHVWLFAPHHRQSCVYSCDSCLIVEVSCGQQRYSIKGGSQGKSHAVCLARVEHTFQSNDVFDVAFSVLLVEIIFTNCWAAPHLSGLAGVSASSTVSLHSSLSLECCLLSLEKNNNLYFSLVFCFSFSNRYIVWHYGIVDAIKYGTKLLNTYNLWWNLNRE